MFIKQLPLPACSNHAYLVHEWNGDPLPTSQTTPTLYICDMVIPSPLVKPTRPVFRHHKRKMLAHVGDLLEKDNSIFDVIKVCSGQCFWKF